MLEKIGLPQKPSLRGNHWVLDASHCQGCSSQFTFINRKHHCRRCGGLFCNSCTQQRMVLRGQGDSPVRICDPCKKLEEAARFELRYGNKNKVGRGGSKLVSKPEEELKNEILDNSGSESVLLGHQSTLNSKIQWDASGASSSSIHEASNRERGAVGSLSSEKHDYALTEMRSATPEELRQEALNQKNKYKVLKEEGKSEEALKAFKRGKELERQAGALELELRKNRKRMFSSNSATEFQKSNDEMKEARRKNKPTFQKNEGKDDLAGELKELGWSDKDLHEADKRPASISLEGELSTLVGEISQGVNSGKGSLGVEKSQVITLKKKALALKREGKLVEAKEELKRAKVLEKQIEEQELLGDAEDSDEEFSSLMRSVYVEKTDDAFPTFDFNDFTGVANDLTIDGNFEVTDEDMDGPELADTLKSLGWTDETAQSSDRNPHLNKESLLSEVQTLKREAVYHKRAGNAAEALELLRKAKVLERDLEVSVSQGSNLMAHGDIHLSMINQLDMVNANVGEKTNSRPASKSKSMIQKELLGLKKRALVLRREGRLDEANEELKKGKILEQQLEDMNDASKVVVSLCYNNNKNVDGSTLMNGGDDGAVTDQDMHDPTYASLLRNLGWKDEDEENSSHHFLNDGNANSTKIDKSSTIEPITGKHVGGSRSKSEIQRELLALKRKSLALRRQGKTEEAEQVLEMAKVLETQCSEAEVPTRLAAHAEISEQTKHKIVNLSLPKDVDEREQVLVEEDMNDPALLSMLTDLGWKDEETINVQAKSLGETSETHVSHGDIHLAASSDDPPTPAPKSKIVIQREILGLKRKALTLRRKGDSEEAEEVLRMAKILESQIEEIQVPKQQPVSDGLKDERKSESLYPNENDVSLKDDRGTNEATVPASVEPHKFLEGLGLSVAERPKSPIKILNTSTRETSQLIELDNELLVKLGPSGHASTEGASFILPSGQMASTMDLLTGERWSSSETSDQITGQKYDVSSSSFSDTSLDVPRVSQKACFEQFRNEGEVTNVQRDKLGSASEKTNIIKLNSVQLPESRNERSSVQQDILAHKRKALALKREGKLAEAKEELRKAKVLEMGMETSNSNSLHMPSSSETSSSSVASVAQKQQVSSSAPKTLSSRDRFKLQQESLNHKRQALKLRREGRTEEAEAEFELAKAIESQLEDLETHDTMKSSSSNELSQDVSVEDFLDPQLLSALKAVGIADHNDITSQKNHRPASEPNVVSRVVNSSEERIQLEERIKAERVKAVNLKRSGKQSEAMEALRRAKMLEKKLNSSAAQ